MVIEEGRGRSRRTKVFTYGTLKKGFSNHRLMEELMKAGEAWYIGPCRTEEKYPLVCGPYKVPFLLNLPKQGELVMGELYEVSETALSRMDELEGISRGHYQRLPIRLRLLDPDFTASGDHSAAAPSDVPSDAEAYFAHSSYTLDMWRKAGHKGFVIYSSKEAKGYVKRTERPPHLTFLDHISLFISSTHT